jgi:hypothetical protein
LAVRYKLCNCVKIHQKKCADAEKRSAEAERSIWCKGAMRNLEEFALCKKCRTQRAVRKEKRQEQRQEFANNFREHRQELTETFRKKPDSKCFCM